MNCSAAACISSLVTGGGSERRRTLIDRHMAYSFISAVWPRLPPSPHDDYLFAARLVRIAPPASSNSASVFGSGTADDGMIVTEVITAKLPGSALVEPGPSARAGSKLNPGAPVNSIQPLAIVKRNSPSIVPLLMLVKSIVAELTVLNRLVADRKFGFVLALCVPNKVTPSNKDAWSATRKNAPY